MKTYTQEQEDKTGGIPTAEYSRIHRWILKEYGKANKCEFCDNIPKRYEWAKIHGKNYAYDISNYIQLCPSCHRKYDMTPEQRERMSLRTKKNPPWPNGENFFNMWGKGSKSHSAKPVLQIDAITGEILKEYGSMVDAANEHGVHKTSLSQCTRGITATCKGFKWILKNSNEKVYRRTTPKGSRIRLLHAKG